MKTYGRLIPFTIFDTIIQCAMPRYLDEGGGGEPSAADMTFGVETPLADGKPTEEVVPAGEESAVSQESKTVVVEEETVPPEGKEPEVSDDELLAELQGEETVEAKLEKRDREYKASSKEAQRLGSENKAYAKFLESQGLKATIKDGVVTATPTEKYSDKPAITEMKLSDLPASDQEALESGDLNEIQSVFDKLSAKQTESLVRAQPNLAKEPVTISDEKKASVFEHMAAETEVDGTLKHENFAMNQNLIDTFVKKAGLGDAFISNPEAIAEWASYKINVARDTIRAKHKAAKAAVEKKEKSGQNAAQLGVDSQGKTTTTDSNATAADEMFGPMS